MTSLLAHTQLFNFPILIPIPLILEYVILRVSRSVDGFKNLTPHCFQLFHSGANFRLFVGIFIPPPMCLLFEEEIEFLEEPIPRLLPHGFKLRPVNE